MSEINRGIPEGVTQKATIINFDAAKEKRLEEKNRQAHWSQERKKKPITPSDANPPISPQAVIERNQKPHPEKHRGIPPANPHTEEIQPPAEIKNNVIDFQTAWEKRLLIEQTDAGVSPESDTFTPPDFKPRPNEAGENVVNEQEDDEQIALAQIRTKLARLEVPAEKRDGIIDGLADDPKTSVKVAGVLRHITPPDVRRQVAIELEENATFCKNLWDKLDEKQAALQEESKDGSFMELLLGFLKEFMTGKTDEEQDTQDVEAVNR